MRATRKCSEIQLDIVPENLFFSKRLSGPVIGYREEFENELRPFFGVCLRMTAWKPLFHRRTIGGKLNVEFSEPEKTQLPAPQKFGRSQPHHVV